MIQRLWLKVGNSASLRPFAKREVMPGNLKAPDLENFVSDALMSYAHQTVLPRWDAIPCRLSMALSRSIYGVDNLCVADGIRHAAHDNWKHYGAMRDRR